MYYCHYHCIVQQWGAPQIHVISVIASKIDLGELLKCHPDVHFTVGCLDDRLNANGDLAPGMGDIGDRLFGAHNL